MRYEYIKKNEIYKRVQDLGYVLPNKSYMQYSHYEGIEWLTCRQYKITAQRGGNWLQVIDRGAHVNGTHTYVRYSNGTYLERY